MHEDYRRDGATPGGARARRRELERLDAQRWARLLEEAHAAEPAAEPGA